VTKRKILLFAVLFGLTIAILFGCSSKSDDANKDSKTPIKKYSMQDLKNQLQSDNSSILFINFWATYCGECRKEMPDLIQFYDEFKGKVKLIGLSLDESEDEVRNFIKISKVNFPIYMSDKELAKHLMINAIPVTFIFKNGKYAGSHLGSYSFSQLKEDFEKLK